MREDVKDIKNRLGLCNGKEYKNNWRFIFIASLLILAILGIVYRIVDLGIEKRDFLLKEGSEKSVFEVPIGVTRGRVLDRNGKEIAINLIRYSTFVNPKIFKPTRDQFLELSVILGIDTVKLEQKIFQSSARGFLYLKRGLENDVVEKIKSLGIQGLFLQKDHKRYYYDGVAMSSIVGFTDIDSNGIEGLELAYNDWLKGVDGKMRILQDRMGNIVENLGILKDPKEGNDIVLSIDKDIQNFAYLELERSIKEYEAESGTIVILATDTGEVLGAANYPSCDSNNRTKESMNGGCYKNKAITDLFEPGSTIKPFSVLAALETGKYQPTSIVDTNPGRLKIDRHFVYDDEYRNNGVLTLTGVLQKSSNIGIAKVILSMSPHIFIDLLNKLGFGKTTQSGFPGEASGLVTTNVERRPFVLATMAFGYSVSVTAMQLARAYSVIANCGLLKPISFVKVADVSFGERIAPEEYVVKLLNMMKSVVDVGGTGTRAKIEGYSVVGKTGTSRMTKSHGYYKNKHVALFAGIAPASNPKIAVIVVITNPHGRYHGGSVAAPVFSKVAGKALHILRIPKDI